MLRRPGTPRAQPLTQEQRESIVAFEMQIFTAQQFDFRAGMLDADGAQGGPRPLVTQEYYFGINDPLGARPGGIHAGGDDRLRCLGER